MTATETKMEFSEDQVGAIKAIDRWIDDHRVGRGKQTLTLGGYAGTGKSTLIAHVVRTRPFTSVAALAGKAANVLRLKGIETAQTIHSLIYEPVTDENGRTKFELKGRLPLTRLIVIDEASMVSTALYADLLSFGLPILFVGDHGQLEPIGDNPNLMRSPEIRLERIHRQAAGDPILRLATAFREDRRVPNWRSRDGRLEITGRGEFWRCVDAMADSAQFICGYNKTRHEVNAAIRQRLGRRGLLVPGDRIICLRNNRELGLFNGQQAEVVAVHGSDDYRAMIAVTIEDGRLLELDCLIEQFGQDVFKEHQDRSVQLYDYAYCLTAHKSQGSEFPTVVALEQIGSSWEPRRWRYTVGTRAITRLIYTR